MSRSIEEKVDLLVEEGYFSEEGIKREAFKTLLRERSDLRIALAVEEYKRGEITLNRAAEIAGITTEEIKKKLDDRGIPIKRGVLSEKDREAKINDLMENE